MPTSGCIERRNAYKPMHAVLAFEISVGIRALHKHSGAFESRLVAVEPVEELDGKAVLFRPARIHAVKHGRPVLCFRAAGARMQRNDCVACVVFAGQQRFQPHALFSGADFFHFGNDLIGHAFIVFLNTHVGKRHGVFKRSFQLCVFLNRAFDAFELPQNLPGILRVIPKIRHKRLLFKLLRFVAESVDFQRRAEIFKITLHSLKRSFRFFQLNNQFMSSDL